MSIDACFKAAVTFCDISLDTVALTVSTASISVNCDAVFSGVVSLGATVASISVTDAAVVNSAVTSGEACTDSITVTERAMNDGLTQTRLAEFDGNAVFGDQAADAIIITGVVSVTGRSRLLEGGRGQERHDVIYCFSSAYRYISFFRSTSSSSGRGTGHDGDDAPSTFSSSARQMGNRP